MAMARSCTQASCLSDFPATRTSAGEVLLSELNARNRVTEPNSPESNDPFRKQEPHGPPPEYSAPPPQYGQQFPAEQPGFGQPQYGQQPAGYQQVPSGYYPVFNSQGQQVLVPLASPGKRFGTYLLDGVLVVVTLFIGYLIWLLFFTWKDGQTPGKKIMKMKYVNTSTGRVADWGKSAMRDFLIRGLLIGIISSITFYIGFLICAFMIFDKDKNYQAGWDRIAGTVVIDVSNVQL
jgi:uncharacterized RDD family membrane protein YckC